MSILNVLLSPVWSRTDSSNSCRNIVAAAAEEVVSTLATSAPIGQLHQTQREVTKCQCVMSSQLCHQHIRIWMAKYIEGCK